MDYTATLQMFLPNANPEMLNIFIEKAKQEIKNYCNIDEIPSDLDYEVVFVARDAFKSNQSAEISATTPNLTEIQRGDVQYKFNSNGNKDVSGVLLQPYLSKLKRFRKLVW